jgi:hypothetical protein
MKNYKTYLIALTIILIANLVFPQIMGFFDINPSSYITYVHWFTMVGIFALVLPSVKNSVFD